MEKSSSVYHWHGQFNVYVLKNKDVLLLSSGQQLLLPQEQFPFVDEIDGKKTLDDILVTKTNLDERASLFLYQINKLVELNVIDKSAGNNVYQKPSFVGEAISRLIQSSESNITLSSLSLCNDAVIKQIEQSLTASLNQGYNTDKDLQVIVVDDLLDKRIEDCIKSNNFLVLKVSGEAISVTSIFSKHELSLFIKLQGQLLENQPVRKTLELCYPTDSHAYPFEFLEQLNSKCINAIDRLLEEQFFAFAKCDNKVISIYRPNTDSFESHVINNALGNNVEFSNQIDSPIALESCISRFNIDGGSRSVTATQTVEKLMPLVSPITGVINHLEVIGENPSSPIKIYRTGFFKTPNKAELTEFDRNSFVQICLGKGVSHDQSKASALSEAIERYAALYQSDVDLLELKHSELLDKGFRAVNFQSLVPYSADQYHKFNQADHPDSKLKQAAKPYRDELIHWLPTWSLTLSEQVYVPLSQCFSNIPFSDDEFGRWHSNGCAAGNTLEEAILQALFELIERDATAIWWYNKLVCPRFDLDKLNPDNLQKLDKCLSPDSEVGHDYWVLDLTSDLGIPVMGAFGRDKVTGGLVMGFGCHLIPEMAAQRALTELCQLIPIRDQNAAPFDFDLIEVGEHLEGSSELKSNTYAIKPSSDIKDDISAVVSQLKLNGMEVMALNYSRAHIPLFTAKVFVPGLCHIWPQLANERLYQAPIKMGCLAVANTEQSINQQALYI